MLTFHIGGASFADREGAVQRRAFTLDAEVRASAPAAPGGGIPVSVWRRFDD